jgi:hypothetical protein
MFRATRNLNAQQAALPKTYLDVGHVEHEEERQHEKQDCIGNVDCTGRLKHGDGDREPVDGVDEDQECRESTERVVDSVPALLVIRRVNDEDDCTRYKALSVTKENKKKKRRVGLRVVVRTT